MKTIFSWLGAAMLLFSSELSSQAIFQSYYQWSNIINVDHGSYRKVKTWMNGTTPMYFAVGGANNPANTNAMATFSCVDGSTGAMVFTKIISSPFPVTQTFEAVALAITDDTPTPSIAVLCNYNNGSGKTQVLLYKFQSNGLLSACVNLGEGIGADVVYNTDVDCFDVLSEVTTPSGTDFEIAIIDQYSLTVLFSNTYNWGAQDKPAALVIDNGDIVAAGYTEVGADRQIFMVRTSAYAYLMWAQAFGLANRRETISDVVYYLNTDSQFRYGFCGWDESTDQAFVGDVSVLGPTYGYKERYITTVNSASKKTHAKSLARSENNIYVCGLYENNAPFIAMFSKNANLSPLNFRIYDDGEDVKEELFDIHYEFGQPDVVSVGYQKRSAVWNGSPANQNYSWIMDMTKTGFATCKTSAGAGTVLYSETQAYGLATEAASDTGTLFTGYANPTFFVSLDNCVTPARLMGPGEEENEAVQSISALYPNPGNGIFYLDGVFDEDKTGLLRVTDISGRLLCEEKLIAGNTKQTIDLTDLPDGIYVWSVLIDGEQVRCEKIVIVR